MRQFIFIILCVLMLFNLYAEEQKITLSEAIRIAQDNNLELKKMDMDCKISKIQYDQAIGQLFLPEIGLTGSTGIIDPQSASNAQNISILSEKSSNINLALYDPNTSSVSGYIPYTYVDYRTQTNINNDFYSTSISIRKNIFNGFRNWNNYLAKEKIKDFQNLVYQHKKNELSYDIAISFYKYLLIKENVRLFNDLYNNTSNRLMQLQDKYQSGKASQYDYLRMQVQFKNIEIKYLNEMNELTNAKILLSKFIKMDEKGSDLGPTYDFTGDISDITNIKFYDVDDNTTLELALSNSIEIADVRNKKELIDINQKIIEGDFYPTVSAYFNYNYDYKYFNAYAINRSWVNSWNCGLQLNYQFDAFLPYSRSTTAWQEINARKQKHELEIKEADFNLRLSLTVLKQQLKESHVNIENQMATIEQAKLAMDLADEKYNANKITLIELKDAEIAYLETTLNYLQAFYDYYSALVKLKKIIGVYDFNYSINK